ncbi:MFS general substrate transporter [Hymenopellis radicata]|nr:MFS general substrate transporter [Hymenopellis radicata]
MATPGTATPATMTASATHLPRSTGPPDAEVDTAASMVDTIDEPALDIEHMPVENDPRMWSPARKNFVLTLIASGSMIAGFAANIQNPAIEDMEEDLPATSSQISLSVSLFILMQGSAPLLWSAISEVKGRRFVYLVSVAIFFAGSVVVATSKSIGLVIGMRILQAAGCANPYRVFKRGNVHWAATLADIFDPTERGTKMGIYYISPLLGPSLGPIIGGGLTTAFNWRAVFWFLSILAGVVFLGFLLLYKDTFRKERSATYQALIKRRLKEQAAKKLKEEEQAAQSRPESLKEKEREAGDREARTTNSSRDVEKAEPMAEVGALVKDPTLKISMRDVNPIKPLWLVLRRWNNALMLFASGLIFSYCFTVVYTTSRTLGSAYGYNPLKIGLVLLSFGLGNVAGSYLGGRWSDIQLSRLTEKNGGKTYAEMRLQSTKYAIWLFPISVVGLGWVCQQHVHVSAICVMLFLSGFFVISVYSSTLAYIVDANVGRSSTAVALNSFFRGVAAFLGTEIAVPIQDGLGDGWMYTIFAIALLFGSAAILLTMKKGEEWRTKAEASENKS